MRLDDEVELVEYDELVEQLENEEMVEIDCVVI